MIIRDIEIGSNVLAVIIKAIYKTESNALAVIIIAIEIESNVLAVIISVI